MDKTPEPGEPQPPTLSWHPTQIARDCRLGHGPTVRDCTSRFPLHSSLSPTSMTAHETSSLLRVNPQRGRRRVGQRPSQSLSLSLDCHVIPDVVRSAWAAGCDRSPLAPKPRPSQNKYSSYRSDAECASEARPDSCSTHHSTDRCIGDVAAQSPLVHHRHVRQVVTGHGGRGRSYLLTCPHQRLFFARSSPGPSTGHHFVTYATSR